MEKLIIKLNMYHSGIKVYIELITPDELVQLPDGDVLIGVDGKVYTIGVDDIQYEETRYGFIGYGKAISEKEVMANRKYVMEIVGGAPRMITPTNLDNLSNEYERAAREIEKIRNNKGGDYSYDLETNTFIKKDKSLKYNFKYNPNDWEEFS